MKEPYDIDRDGIWAEVGRDLRGEGGLKNDVFGGGMPSPVEDWSAFTLTELDRVGRWKPLESDLGR